MTEWKARAVEGMRQLMAETRGDVAPRAIPCARCARYRTAVGVIAVLAAMAIGALALALHGCTMMAGPMGPDADTNEPVDAAIDPQGIRWTCQGGSPLSYFDRLDIDERTQTGVLVISRCEAAAECRRVMSALERNGCWEFSGLEVSVGTIADPFEVCDGLGVIEYEGYPGPAGVKRWQLELPAEN